MSGELILKKGVGGKNRLLAMVITAVITLLVMMPVVRVLQKYAGTDSVLSQMGIAILAPLLIWLLYPQMSKLLPDGEEDRTLRWSVKNGVLTLGDAAIPQKEIKMVHCWQKDGGWTVNIETTGKNYLLRSVSRGQEAERSAQRLYDLVDALGYRSQWREV